MELLYYTASNDNKTSCLTCKEHIHKKKRTSKIKSNLEPRPRVQARETSEEVAKQNNNKECISMEITYIRLVGICPFAFYSV